ncbi:hypothetical protein HY57_13500 [Dyella japonica A8]|uniref:KfrA N-terminal DNA-binding domain-containing protein n=1 Tax=Dyella japonica A8 TaxID=1217721 RepID=A0A075K3C1_9GAMM|nr:hypothetical protein HY57_13500 [Dyella japonica A8]
MRHQRDQPHEQLERQQAELNALRAEHAATQTHIRAMEDRAHQRVDQGRQEIKALVQQQERTRREHAKQVTELMAGRDTLQAALRTSEQALAHQAGQVAALGATVKQWRHVQAAPSKRAPRKATTASKSKAGRNKAGQ